MKRALLPSSAFVRAARRFVKKQPAVADDIAATLDLLTQDAFDPRLKTHRLKGALRGSLACSAGYDLRIVFSIVKRADGEAILLESVGTHDEVY